MTNNQYSENPHEVRAVAWNEDLSDARQMIGVGDLDGDATVTDHASKTVMLQAGRRDNIIITEVSHVFDEETRLPDEVSVIKRTATYYGPKLVVHDEGEDGEDYNYLLTSPGPGSQLLLWGANTRTDEDGRKWRSSWYAAAEVKASLAAEQPPYPECPDCGELVRTIQHERMAAIGMCDRA